jgi:serine protease Do
MKRIGLKPLLLCLVLVLSLVATSGCIILPEEWFIPPANVEEPIPTTPTTPAPSPIDPEQASPEPCNDGEPLPDFVAVVEKVKPSVVAIQTDVGSGSGWIIREDGIIVSNNHVVSGAETIVITMDDGRTFTAQEVRTDPLTDLAVVTIDADGLPAAEIGNCELLKVGQPVAAIGNALGLGIRMTGGWISRLGVSITVSAGQTLDDLIETDAAINPGNSGGPLVNMSGEVIGITSVKVSQVGVEGLGYAISMTTAKDVIDQLILKGYVIRPYLGVGLSDVNPVISFLNDLAVDEGVLVTKVAEESPAAEAGLEEGDVIVQFGGEEIANSGELLRAIHNREIGDTVEIVYFRGEEENTTEATLIESPPPSD